MSMDIAKAKRFVAGIDLSGTPRPIVEMGASEDASKVFTDAKNQAQIVGSGLFAFAKGVDAEVREAISASALLAQLVANKNAPKKDPLKWFEEYSKVLQNVGWTLQSDEWTDYTAKGTAAEVNEKIIEVITAALAPHAGALAIVTSAVNALKAMNPGSSWFTIFSRETQKAEIARFQVGLVEESPDKDVFVYLVACLIQAKSAITQVLFFKYRKNKATFKANSNKVSVDRDSLKELKAEIRKKIRDHQAAFLSSIKDL
jgi:hypothetical protein